MTQPPNNQLPIRILIVDEDDDVIVGLSDLGGGETLPGLDLIHAPTLADAKTSLERDGIDLIAVDVHPSSTQMLDLLPVLNELAPDLPLVVWLPEADREMAMRVIRMGAQDCLDKTRLDAYWLIRSFEYAIDRKRAEREKRQMEEQLWESQKMESLGVLAGGVAHDFNNLLCGIMGNASLARETVPQNSPAGECLRDIERVSERATALCRQMLAYAGGRQSMAEEFDLNDLVSQKPELLKTSVSREARLIAELSERALVATGDRSQIGQVIVNLVINASDALGGLPGEIRLTTSLVEVGLEFFKDTILQRDLPPGLYNCLCVTDSGTGMDRPTRERIFEPFFTTKFVGRGMGLPAALGIVRSHGGAMKVVSEPGKGSTFSVYLPYSGVAEAPASEERCDDEEWSDHGLVLVEDDEEPVRNAAARFLRHLGLSVIEAMDGTEGYERFMSNRGQLRAVVMDLTMPGLDGASLCAAIRQIDPEVPILLMSGYNRSSVMQRVNQNLPFMEKPFKFHDFRSHMRGLLAGRADEPGE